MTRVKICGITGPEDARAAVEAGADLIGLVFAPSPRRIDHATAVRIRTVTRDAPPSGASGVPVLRVGVFVDAGRAEIEAAIEAGGLDLVQLHGSESPALCQTLPVPVVKTVRVGRDPVDDWLDRYPAAYFLADTHVPGVEGGSGRRFDWELARPWARRCALFLAGGLTAMNVGEAIARVAPHGIDVSSGVEQAPGRKSPAAMRALVAAVREADARGAGRQGVAGG
ncbi:MAG: phosphoribosylanthranilate isomerase [Candidatus Eiseniibacteriota bacterium]|jgi:phosphoribosylanthranilate isomerase